MVVAALLAVVVGQALLANGQVRLSACSTSSPWSRARTARPSWRSSQLETPARIVAAASGQLHMVRPASVVELPYVSLSVPLPTPKVTPAPAPPPPTTSPAGAGAPAGTGAGSSSSGARPPPRPPPPQRRRPRRRERHDPTRASPRARWFRPRESAKSGSAATTAQGRATRGRPSASAHHRPGTPAARPARRRSRPTPAAARAATAVAAAPARPATAAPAPPAGEGGPAPGLASAPGLGERHLPAPGPAGPLRPHRGHAAPGGPAGRRAGAARRRATRRRRAGSPPSPCPLPSLRGGIYDRDGSPLALSVPTDDVVADDFQVAHPVQTALALSPILHVPATTLASELHRPHGLRGPGPPAAPGHRPEDRRRRLPRHHA